MLSDHTHSQSKYKHRSFTRHYIKKRKKKEGNQSIHSMQLEKKYIVTE